MKLPSFSPIMAFVRTHIFLVAGIAGLVVVAAGTLLGWRYYQYRQSAEFAFVRFKEALQPVNMEELLQRVDFNALTMPLVKAAARHYPFAKKGAQQEVHLKDAIQTALFQQTRLKEESSKEDLDDITRLIRPLYVLPSDFLTQLAATLTLQGDDGRTALLTATIHHTLLNKDFPVQLRMDHTTAGWRVRTLANAEELVGQFRAAQVERMQGQRQILVDKNVRTAQQMAEILPIKECAANAALLSDRKTLLLVVTVDGKNESSVVINNMNLSATVSSASGQELLHRYLNAVAPIMPKQPLHYSWTIELDSAGAEGKAVLAAGPLACQGKWQTLGLASGTVLHIAEVPEPLEEIQ